MSRQTLSQWVKEQLHKPSVIKHPPTSRLVFACKYYFSVAKGRYANEIIGMFHLDYLGEQPIKFTTLQGIQEELINGASLSLLRTHLATLVQDGWLQAELIGATEAKTLLTNKHPQFLSVGKATCEWCKCSTIATQKHHYPLAKSQGGKVTVDICANCHFEFHQLLSVPRYKPTERLIAFFESDLDQLKFEMEERK